MRVADPFDLQRFVDSQMPVYDEVRRELTVGRKRSHWMWFIFPQLRGIGRSPTAEFYGISSLPEAQAYLGHPLLGPRLNECLEAILPWAGRLSARHILGDVDALKLCSSLTLFDQAEPNARFDAGLQAFFGGNPDERTLALLNARR
jgi:uncharacterized protein (DUF1810 family)